MRIHSTLRAPRRRLGFTLIELLIVIGIVGLLFVPMTRYLTQLSIARSRAEARAESFAVAESFTRRWREDVRRARRIDIGDEGKALELEMGSGRVVRYVLEDAGVKRTETVGALPAGVVLPDVKELQFTRVGRGVQVNATRRAYDGLHYRDEALLAIETPLTALQPRGE